MIRPEEMRTGERKLRLLLHCCCAPCSSATLERVLSLFDTDIYYYNPNIEPYAEFEKRAGEEQRFVREFRPEGDVNVIVAEYDHEAFEKIARGREALPERGERCYLCYELRLRKTALYAREHGYDCFTTSLSISPYKSSRWINEIGMRLEKETGVTFVWSDFKKQDGYRRSIALSKEYGLYRQDWCGCVYSKAERERKKQQADAAGTEREKALSESFGWKKYTCVSLRERPDLLHSAAAWFHAKWGVPQEAYLKCMRAYLDGDTEYGWYLCLDGDQIAGGLGVIENDFHDRRDLAPNVCAVYTEEACRGQGIAGRLLNLVVQDQKAKGITPLYLVTDHIGFYERYGWEFFCLAQGDGETEKTRVYIHR